MQKSSDGSENIFLQKIEKVCKTNLLCIIAKNFKDKTMITKNSVIKICYSARSLEGELLDATPANEPLTFNIGKGELPEEIEKNLLGLKEGDKKKVILTPEMLFGDWMEENVLTIPRSHIPDDDGQIQKNKFIDLRDNEGNMFRGFVVDITDEGYVIDFNHPFAGKTIEYDIEIISVE
ncbi:MULTISPECIES: FKBP-type peptidyl-prolyl cis-trans isomerase [Calditerrivibrio]|jgi:FKBP-type peptidyl-prolyl cis-trans isomerase 2|uniref:Peptidyl-prolyl cis-trans isomerase n=1 Tax=Calditerrivibrio nitroreducens TaxID=477976 RepID=A0A2J6WM29_9BACT|nr:MAG: peptidylprolyl isomerase [Calditerrivibrio nitroreducens]